MPDAGTGMSVGETRSNIEVKARERWNPTGIHVLKRQRFRLRAEGSWNDSGIDTGPNGFHIDTDAPAISRWLLKLCVPLLRVKTSRYFCLIGSVDRDSPTFFAIGPGVDDWSVSDEGGELHCFANDVPFAYWNNKGSIRLSVTRIA